MVWSMVQNNPAVHGMLAWLAGQVQHEGGIPPMPSWWAVFIVAISHNSATKPVRPLEFPSKEKAVSSPTPAALDGG